MSSLISNCYMILTNLLKRLMHFKDDFHYDREVLFENEVNSLKAKKNFDQHLVLQ